MLKISDRAEFIINKLEEEGFQAYAVGGALGICFWEKSRSTGI